MSSSTISEVKQIHCEYKENPLHPGLSHVYLGSEHIANMKVLDADGVYSTCEFILVQGGWVKKIDGHSIESIQKEFEQRYEMVRGM